MLAWQDILRVKVIPDFRSNPFLSWLGEVLSAEYCKRKRQRSASRPCQCRSSTGGLMWHVRRIRRGEHRLFQDVAAATIEAKQGPIKLLCGVIGLIVEADELAARMNARKKTWDRQVR